MKSVRLAFGVCLFALALFAVSIAASIPALPDRVATHFNHAGGADGWSSRATYLLSFSVVAFGISLFAPLLAYTVRFFPASTLSVPHSDYWRAPENYPRACSFLFHHTLWLSALNLFFMRSIHQTIVTANLEQIPTLATDGVGIGVGIYVTGMIVWATFLIRFFCKVPRRGLPSQTDQSL